MSYELIISEKPSAAKKIAEALADGKTIKKNINKVPYYELSHNKRDIVVVCAVGHLYKISEKTKSPWSKYPVFDVEWVASADVDKNSSFSKKYLNVIKKLKKDADEFTVACDYDIEGEVIGLNIIRNICKAKDANRMKFSTLTKNELIKAYENKSKTLDWGQANAGETRHILDFYYGINLTRALTDSINKNIGGFKVLSSGRVQGPALKMVVDKEKEIRAFVPVPYWQIELIGKIKTSDIKAMHKGDKIWDEKEAKKIMQNIKDKKEGFISKNEKKEFKQTPPVPFDLTSLQIEAHRCFRIKPKRTLELAQNLYTEGVISYPRTSSQKLPPELGFKNILSDLKKQEFYTILAEKILKTKLIPNEGKKIDAAHPAIYPTGQVPSNIDEYEFKIYDLIVKRFLSVFAEPAVRETNTLTIDVNKEEFITKGTVTKYKGWHEFYTPYVKNDETELPIVKKDDLVNVNSIEKLSKETRPPKRYTQASIISELEKRGLGTKATRAQIIETLFARGYVTGDNNIQVNELGIQTSDVLEKYCPDIVNEELTKQFEEEMDKIREKKLTEEQVLEKAKKVLIKIIDVFKKQEKLIGKELSDANKEAIKIATTVGKCPKCKDGELVIKKGKFGRFIACNKYPDCKTIFNIPKTGSVKPTDKVCEVCKLPVIIIKQPKRSPQEVCINVNCPSKQENEEGESVAIEHYPEEGMTCPTCNKGKMILRKSFYGSFLGCNAYPKCKTMMKIIDGKVDTKPIVQKPKTKKKKTKK